MTVLLELAAWCIQYVEEGKTGHGKKPQATTEHDPDEFIFGRHAVEAALKAGTAATINKLFVQTDLKSEPIQHLVGMAQKKKILVSTAPKQKLDLMSDQGNHQGVLLAMTPYAYATLDDLFKMPLIKAKIRFSCCWITWKIHTTWAPFYGQQMQAGCTG